MDDVLDGELMTKIQILIRLFLAVSMYFLIFSLITGFMYFLSTPSNLEQSRIITQIVLYINFTILVGMIVAIILCTICWLVFPPPRNTILPRFVFLYLILVVGLASPSGSIRVISPYAYGFSCFFTIASLISSQLIFNYYLNLVSTLKIKQKNEDI